jgi:hypothetical protein
VSRSGDERRSGSVTARALLILLRFSFLGCPGWSSKRWLTPGTLCVCVLERPHLVGGARGVVARHGGFTPGMCGDWPIFRWLGAVS